MVTRLNPYLSFRDNAREAIEFYHSVLGGELALDTFGASGIPDAPADGVMHSQITTDDGLVLMAADTPPGMPYKEQVTSVSISGDDEAELRGYWEKLSRRRIRIRPSRGSAVGRHLRNAHRPFRRHVDGEHRGFPPGMT